MHNAGFHFLVWLFAVRSIRDTQCGFKLMTRSTARLCFPSLHIERWLFLINFYIHIFLNLYFFKCRAFDVELIYIAEYLNIPTGTLII